MKKMIMVALLCIVSLGCAQQKQSTNTLQEISYRARTRGFFYEVSIMENEIRITREEGQSIAVELPAGVWNELKEIVTGMDLEGLNQLKAPTRGNATDRAAIAEVAVVTHDRTYQSASFDHGSPPKALEGLVNKIVQLAETVE